MRSLPSTKTYRHYFDAYMYFLGVFLAYNFIAICLVYEDFMIRMPTPFVLAIPIIFIKVYLKLESGHMSARKDTFKETIGFIRLNQMHALREQLEENPELLHMQSGKKSLLYWARHHKNLEANSIIIEELKKTSKPLPTKS